MKYRTLGNTDLQVSVIGLGTMTWGHQNSEADAHAQLDYALSQGVNLVDAAELYPTPSRAETWGDTERFIGTWLAKTGRRNDIVLTSKIVGPPRQAGQTHIREGKTRFNRAFLNEALDASLQRLQTDYVDLYQLHWPERSTNFFGQRDYPWSDGDASTPIEETLDALGDLVKSGKVRHVGICNETPWGAAQYLKHSERGLPRIASIQNPYSLLNRLYEGGLAEFGHREQVGLLAYSPLAAGVLSGKYLNGAQPPGARLTAGTPFGRGGRYQGDAATQAAGAYIEIARRHDVPPVQLALAFVASRPFLTSALSGATSVEQLRNNLESVNVELNAEILGEIDAVHARFPNPSP